MHADGDGQLDIRRAAGVGDADEVVVVFLFGKDLVQIEALFYVVWLPI
jgi:hypothetical protein